jgi:hypothetical protein
MDGLVKSVSRYLNTDEAVHWSTRHFEILRQIFHHTIQFLHVAATNQPIIYPNCNESQTTLLTFNVHTRISTASDKAKLGEESMELLIPGS